MDGFCDAADNDTTVKRLDWYIIRKFLGTFFFSIVLILSIAIVFDITEKIDDFFEEQIPLREIIVDYYFNFIPYYMNMFSSLFIFISVIFFTSKLASNSEIIAMHAAGVSYKRLMLPYLLSATLLFVLSFVLGGYVIPPANGKMLAFTDKYVDHFSSTNARNVQAEIAPGTVLYIETLQKSSGSGYRASLEHFDDKTLVARTTCDRIVYDSLERWHMEHCISRRFNGLKETLVRKERIDTLLHITPDEMFITSQLAQQMTNPELREYMRKQQERGTGNIQAFETEYHKRWASPLGAFIMTLLGVTMSSRKVRGGMGKNLGIGLVLTALYILFSTVSTTFAVSGVMSPFMSAWIPNFVFLIIAVPLYLKARKF